MTAPGAVPGAVPDAQAWVAALVARHLERYPAMALADVYKLLHQSAMGPGHAVDDPESARRALLAEVAGHGAVGSAAGTEPVVDPIAPAGALARVHLEPYVAAGLDPEWLVLAFLATASAFVPRLDLVAERCTALVALARDERVPFGWPEVVAEVRRLADLGFPAVRHSEAYRVRYRPAYRVVAGDRIGAMPGHRKDA